MKTLKWLLSIVVVSLFLNGYVGKLFRKEDVHINGIDYGTGLGVVTGTYTYQYTFRLDNAGKLVNMHWNVIANDLVNDSGDKVRVIRL